MPKLIRPTPTPPSIGTLRSYGLTAEEWLGFCRRQRFVCPICLQPFGDRKLVVDHEHVRGFRARKRRKSKKRIGGKRADVSLRVMSPAERRVHVRGVIHAWCNGYVRSWLTLTRARSIVAYLESHEERKHEDRKKSTRSVPVAGAR